MHRFIILQLNKNDNYTNCVGWHFKLNLYTHYLEVNNQQNKIQHAEKSQSFRFLNRSKNILLET